MHRLSLFLTVLLCTFIISPGHSAVPRFLNYQGEVMLPDGTLVTGVETITFAIYNLNGTRRWTETLDITLDNGQYSVTLGEETPFPVNLFDGRALSLGVTVGDGDEFRPRDMIVSVPYAIMTGEVDGTVNATGGIFLNSEELINSDGQWVGDFKSEGETTVQLSTTGVECGNNTGAGGLRWNDNDGLLEVCNGTSWEAAGLGGDGTLVPRITSVSPNPINPSEDTTITIYGENFEDGCVVEIGGEEKAVTFISDTELQVDTGTLNGGVYDVRVINPTEIVFNYRDGLEVDASPEWVTDTDLGSAADSGTAIFTVEASDAEGDVTYAVVEHTLPSEPTIDASTGEFSFEPDEVSEETDYTITISATDEARESHTITRQFTLTITDCSGLSQGAPAQSCRVIKDLNCGSSDGLYWLDPDGGDTSNAFQAFCDMTTDGGGWTLVIVTGLNSNYFTQTGAMGDQNLIRRSDPGSQTIHKFSDAMIESIKGDRGDAVGIRIIWEVDTSIKKFGKSGCMWESDSANPSSEACDYFTGSYSENPSWSGPYTNYWFCAGIPCTSGGSCSDHYRMGMYRSSYSATNSSKLHIGSCSVFSWGTIWVR